MIRQVWLAGAALVILAGCQWGVPDDKKDDNCRSIEGSLPGTWRSACLFLEVRPNEDGDDENIFFRDVIIFDGADFTREYREFVDIDCIFEAERLVVLAGGTYQIDDDFAPSSDGLDVCAIDFDYDEVTREVDEDDVFEEPDTPFTVFDIAYLLPPEPDDGDTPHSLFTGDLDGPFVENVESERPDSINFDVEYFRQ